MWPNKECLVSVFTTGISVEAAWNEFGLRGVAGRVWPAVQSSQGLQHAQQTVWGGELQVLFGHVTHLANFISSLSERHVTKQVYTHTLWIGHNKNQNKLLNMSQEGVIWAKEYTFTQSSISPSSITSNTSCSSMVNSSGWEACNVGWSWTKLKRLAKEQMWTDHNKNWGLKYWNDFEKRIEHKILSVVKLS